MDVTGWGLEGEFPMLEPIQLKENDITPVWFELGGGHQAATGSGNAKSWVNYLAPKPSGTTTQKDTFQYLVHQAGFFAARGQKRDFSYEGGQCASVHVLA